MKTIKTIILAAVVALCSTLNTASADAYFTDSLVPSYQLPMALAATTGNTNITGKMVPLRSNTTICFELKYAFATPTNLALGATFQYSPDGVNWGSVASGMRAVGLNVAAVSSSAVFVTNIASFPAETRYMRLVTLTNTSGLVLNITNLNAAYIYTQ